MRLGHTAPLPHLISTAQIRLYMLGSFIKHLWQCQDKLERACAGEKGALLAVIYLEHQAPREAL